jgi:hypothetical protein
MRLIFIHGPVASGKLTIARELATLTGFRLFHNHLVVDAVGAVFDFGSEPFVALREQTWLGVFREAARHDISLIFTFAPERTVRPSFIPEAIEAVKSADGEVVFVRLTCPMAELERRVTDAARGGFGKLRSLDQFRELARTDAFSYPGLPDTGLTIDTSVTSPHEAAMEIRDFFSLPGDATRR